MRKKRYYYMLDEDIEEKIEAITFYEMQKRKKRMDKIEAVRMAINNYYNKLTKKI